jgi:hypothetical protein
MATNQYFNHFYNAPEQDLLHDLIIESIQNYGIDLWYIKRDTMAPDVYDQFLGESPAAEYKDATQIEGYVKDFDGYQGEGHLATKFGMEIRNQLTFSVSIRRWADLGITEREERPFEGDIIFFPLSKEWFEIKFVQDASIFYQVGEFAIYDLVCEQFDYSHERIDVNTGDTFADDFEDKFGYSMVLDMDDLNADDYTDNELVYQGANPLEPSASGKVVSWDSTTKKLKIKQVYGRFEVDEVVKGDTSGAIRRFILPEIPYFLERSKTGGNIMLQDDSKIVLEGSDKKDQELVEIENENIYNDNDISFLDAKQIVTRSNNPFIK